MSDKTIAAVSTPMGEGGIGIIRISGDSAIAVADKVFRGVTGEKLVDAKGYTAHFGEIFDDEGVIDEAVVTVFHAPKSYTGEDVAEISVHGGRYVVKKVLRTVLSNGAVCAEGGEFTKRAFLNGKMDLTKAESVMGVISATSDRTLKISNLGMRGKIGEEIDGIEKSLVHLAASFAAYADYPDEDLEGLDRESFEKRLVEIKFNLENILKNYDAGRILREGIETAIVGKPNVGKSTLMNLLAGFQRSIVTDIAGTTRDVVEDTVLAGDIVLRLSDTAGIHSTEDTVESLGVKLALDKIDSAELVLAVFDLSKPLDSNDYSLLENIKNRKTVIVLNKNDIAADVDLKVFDGLPTVYISAKNGEGKDELIKAIEDITRVNNINPDVAVLSSERQRACAQRALDAVDVSLEALISGQTIDAAGVCVDDAVAALLELTGKRVTNEVADEVFRSFCVGK